MDITFKAMTHDDTALFFEWAEKEHVKGVWFLEGYSPPEEVYETIDGNGYDYPFIIIVDGVPIGYIQYSDLWAYRHQASRPRGVFTQEPKGTYCFDLFIGEEDHLDRGVGTAVVQAFVDKLFAMDDVERLVIDPSAENKRAIRCYEKAGFEAIDDADDDVCRVTILELPRARYEGERRC